MGVGSNVPVGISPMRAFLEVSTMEMELYRRFRTERRWAAALRAKPLGPLFVVGLTCDPVAGPISMKVTTGPLFVVGLTCDPVAGPISMKVTTLPLFSTATRSVPNAATYRLVPVGSNVKAVGWARAIAWAAGLGRMR